MSSPVADSHDLDAASTTPTWFDAIGTAFALAVACGGVAALILAVADVVFVGERHGFASREVVMTFGIYTLLAVAGGLILTVPVVLARKFWPATTRPKATCPLFLMLYAGLGIAFVIANRDTFEGEGLAATGFARVVEATVIGAGLIALLVALRTIVIALWQRPAPRSTMVAVITLVVGAIIIVTERRLPLGRYAAAHLQAFVFGWSALMTTVAILRSPGRHLRACRVFTAVFVIAAIVFLVVVREFDNLVALGTAGQTPNVQTRRATSLLAPIILRILPPPPEDPDIDVTDDLRRPIVNRHTARARVKRALDSHRRPNILLVSIDTVRADHTGFLGYERRPTTPNWDLLAARSVVFERAYTSYPATGYAYSGLFTSTWASECPQRHAARPIPDDSPLAGLLQKNGYRTLGITGFFPDQIAPGGRFATFRRGFERLEAHAEKERIVDGTKGVDIAETWLDELASDPEKPFFLWVHLFDPHAPYDERLGLDFGSEPIDRYDAEIAWADRLLGRLLGKLDDLGLYENTIVVAHSDHGEAFREHGTEFHLTSLYDEQIRVPLTIHVPGSPQRRCDEVVSLVDLLPTLTTLVGVDDPYADHRRGQNLAGLVMRLAPRKGVGVTSVMPPDPPTPRWAFSQLLVRIYPSRPRHAVIVGRHKVIWTPDGLRPWQVYDLVDDPRELRDLYGRDDDRDRRLRSMVRTVARQAGIDR